MINYPNPEYKITRERIAHMHGVAEYMYRHAPKYNLNPDDMYLLGLLHDIGYLYGKDGHEQRGAELLYDNYYSLKYVMVVEMHGTILSEIEHPSNELLLLVEADMHVDMSGENVGYEKRLEGVAARHGIDSQAYLICKENVHFLRKRSSSRSHS